MTIESRSAAVRLEGVTKKFGAVAAVDDIDLVIEPGTLVTLLGPSGCGKTTTLRMIAGLEMPTSGKVLIGNKDVTLLPPNERDVSMVFQSYALFPHMTVMENVVLRPRRSRSLARGADVQRREKALSSSALVALTTGLPSELSGGQQQRVAVRAHSCWSRRSSSSTSHCPISMPSSAARCARRYARSSSSLA